MLRCQPASPLTSKWPVQRSLRGCPDSRICSLETQTSDLCGTRRKPKSEEEAPPSFPAAHKLFLLPHSRIHSSNSNFHDQRINCFFWILLQQIVVYAFVWVCCCFTVEERDKYVITACNQYNINTAQILKFNLQNKQKATILLLYYCSPNGSDRRGIKIKLQEAPVEQGGIYRRGESGGGLLPEDAPRRLFFFFFTTFSFVSPPTHITATPPASAFPSIWAMPGSTWS